MRAVKPPCPTQHDPEVLVLSSGTDVADKLAELLNALGIYGHTCRDPAEIPTLLLQHSYKALLFHFDQPENDGCNFVRSVRNAAPDLALLVVVAPEHVRSGILAVMAGASDFMVLPVDTASLIAHLAKASAKERLEQVSPKHQHYRPKAW